MRPPATRGRRRSFGRRVQLLLVLAAVAATAGAVAVSSASFVSASSTTVGATTAARSGDSMSVNAGDNQSAVAGTAVPVQPSVRVVDALGNPVSGLTVNFAVTSGGGSVTSASDVTGDDGVAEVGWTLGSTPGTNNLQASCAGITGSPLTFKATGTSGPAVKIAATAGTGQSAVAGSTVAVVPTVRVTDAGGNGVSGVTVTFAVTGGGGSITKTTTTTDSAGYANCGSWKLGATVGTNTLTATSGTLSGSPVTFTATGTVGPASKMSMVMDGGNGQTVHVGTAVVIPPKVLVTDANNNPVSGISVVFAVASGGGSITGSPAVATNASGIAAVGGWTLGTVAGANSLTATSTGLTGSPVTFTATGLTGSPTTIVINGGDGQTATAGAAVATAPSVMVTDIYGNPVQGVAVTFTPASGSGSVTTASTTTNSSGVASCGGWTLGTTAGTDTLTATSPGLTGSPLTFSATGTAGAATKYVVSSSNYNPPAGSPVTITAQLADQYNNPVATSGITVTWSRTGTGGAWGATTTTTNASGVATTTYRVSRTAGRAYTFTARSTTPSTRTGTSATVTVVAGPPTQMALYAGNNQTATVGTAVATAPSVRLRDAYNNNCANAVVTFAVTAGGGTITTTSAATNASGVATCGSWTLGTKVGANTLRATYAGATGSPVTFTATGTVGAASKISLNAGNGQTATVGTAVATLPSVLATDQYNNPVSGVAVTFAVASGGGAVTGAAATTNASGIATVGSWTLGTTAGANSLTATSGTLSGSPVTFTATGVAGAATKYVVTSSSYAPTAGTAVTITAQLADQYNNPVATSGIAVTFTRTPATGTLGTPNPATTNASGVATITFTTATTVGTTYTVTATSTVPSTRTGTSPTITTH
ncbi:MAG TPA: hypothetical protein VMH50_06115 [Thermoleophilia bacterium]|nr:hypothetical protein [Thermoleophilia bacterium]